jgi:hypothetical protein
MIFLAEMGCFCRKRNSNIDLISSAFFLISALLYRETRESSRRGERMELIGGALEP